MFKRVRRLALLGTTLAAGMFVTQPAMAFVQTGHTGTTGTHSVTDTMASPGALCHYTFNSTQDLEKLTHITVYPPNMKALAGMGSEKVGWQFTVQRQIISFSNGPWQNRYTSPVYSAMTDSSHNASFSAEGVKVKVPFPPNGDSAAQYRVIVKGIWYKHDGSTVLGTFTGRVQWYNAYESPDTLQMHYHCRDWDNGGGI